MHPEKLNQIVANLSEFYDAFGVKESDKHFITSGDRVRIW
jgi:predicted metalloendopeptidase